MMRFLKILFLIWLAVFLQSSVINVISPWGLIPNFLVIVIVLAGLKGGVPSGVWAGLLAGILADCYHPSSLGLFSVGGTITGYLAGMARDRIYREQLLSQAALIAAITLFYQWFVFFGREGGSLATYLSYLFRFGLGGALLTAVAAALVMPSLERWTYGKR
jgi:rod shape-determining protein MreD